MWKSHFTHTDCFISKFPCATFRNSLSARAHGGPLGSDVGRRPSESQPQWRLDRLSCGSGGWSYKTPRWLGFGTEPRRKSTRPEPGSRQTARGFGSNGVEKSRKNRGFVLFLMFGDFFFPCTIWQPLAWREHNDGTVTNNKLYRANQGALERADTNHRFILTPLF